MKLYALIMAGGEGKRFWPLSRKHKPKQFLSFIGGKSMITQTVERILPLVPIGNIYVVTLEKYAEETLKHIPDLPKDNLILEPQGKNTAPAIAIGTLKIKKADPDAITLVLPADHAISKDDDFREVLLFASRLAETEPKDGELPLITLGIQPTRPDTGYGYIKEGRLVKTEGRHQGKKVERFAEKPDLDTATEFLRGGGYYWNSGIFIWKASSILSAFEKLIPNWHKNFGTILNDMNTLREKSTLVEFYSQIESAPVDKAILEKWGNTLVIPVDFPWSDIGSWESLDEFLRTDKEKNISSGEVETIESSSNLVIGEKKLIALVGVKDLVVVETDDAILVLDKRKSQDIKKLVEALEKKGKYT